MRSSGFTLIELIVVISIIALVTALLFPVFHTARQQARVTVCQGRIRQLALEFQHYEAANQVLPYGYDFARQPAPPGDYAGDPTVDLMGWWWFDCIKARQAESSWNAEILKCPSKRMEDPRLQGDILCGNYGVNRSLCPSAGDMPPYSGKFSGPAVSSSRVRHASSTLLLVDSGYALICWWHAADTPPVSWGPLVADTAYVPGLAINQDRQLWPGQSSDAINGRHPNKTVNVGFLDGHVERKKAAELLVEETEAGYTNRSPLWDPR